MEKETIPNDGTTLPVVEEFYSVQGEGANAGSAAYFVRLAGCDVRCPFCDSKATWSITQHPLVDVADIVARAANTPAKTAVITGGEPLMHNLDPLCEALHRHGITIWLETSGSHRLTGSFDWICVSPKTQKPPIDELLRAANELKVVIEDAQSFQFAERCAAQVSEGCALTLQAEWDGREAVYPQIFSYVLEHPEWRISIQTHKILNIR